MENSRTLEVCREHDEKFLTEEFIWKMDGLETLTPTEGPCEWFTVEELHMRNSIHLVKNGKATGPSVVASDMLKCSGEARIR